MNKSELLTVDDVFMIDQLGLVVAPDFSVPNNDWKPSNETVTILRPDGTEFDAVAQFNHSHFNIPDPTVSMDRRWRVTICVLNVTKNAVPIRAIAPHWVIWDTERGFVFGLLIRNSQATPLALEFVDGTLHFAC